MSKSQRKESKKELSVIYKGETDADAKGRAVAISENRDWKVVAIANGVLLQRTNSWIIKCVHTPIGHRRRH